MINSPMLENINQDFQSLIDETEDEEYEELFYLFDQGMASLDSEHLESSLICFCSVIEAVVNKRRDSGFKTFDSWIKEEKRLDEFIEDLNSDSPKAAVDEWFDDYREKYGVRRSFGRLVAEAFRCQEKFPKFLKMKTEKTDAGTTRSTYRDIGDDFETIDEAYEKVEQVVKKRVYDDYRSALVHEGSFASPFVEIKTKIGGSSSPDDLSIQSVANFALTVLQVEVRDNWED